MIASKSVKINNPNMIFFSKCGRKRVLIRMRTVYGSEGATHCSFIRVTPMFSISKRLFVCLFVFNVPSTARSFRDSTPIYCPLLGKYTVPIGKKMFFCISWVLNMMVNSNKCKELKMFNVYFHIYKILLHCMDYVSNIHRSMFWIESLFFYCVTYN